MARDGLRSRKGGDAAGENDDSAAAGGAVSMETLKELAGKGRVTMVVEDVAYDFTEFIDQHPGGADYLKKNAGKVATEEFTASHPADIIERTLSTADFEKMTLGPIDKSTIKAGDIPKVTGGGDHGAEVVPDGNKPSIESCINTYDFEAIASRICPEQGWVYYSSGADDEITLRENHNAFHRIWMRPRVMVNVKEIDMTTTILGHKTSMPMMLSAVAMCKLGHPEGETAWSKGASREGIIYMVPTLSGCSFQQIVDAKETADYPMFYQLYVNPDREKTKKLVQTAEAKGCSALFITCDAPQLGNRERDRRTKVTHSGAAAQGGKSGGSGQGTSKALTTFIDPSLNWDDLKWFMSITDMKIVLKGVATAEDAVMALEHGVAGVMLSNHGGRQLDFARSAIEVLPEAMEALKAHKKYNPETFEVFIDGGVRRGSDIYKALALGAKAVGVGRPALYAMTAYGADGVQKMIQILKSELEMTMRLMGAPSIADISPKGVITTDLGRHVSMVPPDMLQRETYIPPVTQAYMNKFDRAGTKPAAAAAAPVAAGDGSQSDGVVLVLESAKSILKTIFTTDVKTLLHRTALFMILFLVVHLKGNLFFFLGPAYMNGWGTFLTTGVVGNVIMAVEYYLLAAGVAHAVAGAYQTWRYKKLALPKKDLASYPMGQAKLQLTGTVLAAYIYLHLTHFKFAEIGLDADGNRDLYGQVVKVLADPVMLAVYVGATALLGAHLWSGWAKTVLKFEIADAAQKKRVATLGQTLVAIITVGFIAVSVAAHLTPPQTGNTTN